MKKVILIVILVLTSLVGFGQDSVSSVNKEEKSFESIIKDYVTDAVDFAKTEGSKAYELAKKEIPDVVRQWLLFESIASWFLIIISVVISVVSVKLGIKSIKQDWQEDGAFIAVWVILLPNIISIITFFSNIFTAIKVTFFPKLYLVQEFINLV